MSILWHCSRIASVYATWIYLLLLNMVLPIWASDKLCYRTLRLAVSSNFRQLSLVVCMWVGWLVYCVLVLASKLQFIAV